MASRRNGKGLHGGSRGIGAAVAKRLAADGANVAITYAKDAKAASAVVKAIECAGQKAIKPCPVEDCIRNAKGSAVHRDCYRDALISQRESL